MRLFSSKKAEAEPTEETIYPIIAVSIAIVVVMLQLLSLISGLKDNTIFERTFLERDIANTIDSIYASPENIFIDYDKDAKLFSFIFDRNYVNAYEKTSIINQDNLVGYFSPDKKTAYSTIELKPVFAGEQPSIESLIKKVDMRLAKTDRRISVNEKNAFTPEMNEMECPEIENSRRFSSSPSKGFNDIVDINDAAEKSYAARYDIFVWYYPGSYDDTAQNTIKAFISSDANLKENRRLACLILNQLLERLGRISRENSLEGVTGVAIVPTDYWQMLSQERQLSVLLEIGNKNIPQEKNIWSNENARNAILEAIDAGVKSYG